jgi:Spy/CpxP family protein refolding chaperone
LFVTVLAIGTAVFAAQAQQEPSSPPPMPPPPTDQAKPKQPRPSMTDEQRAELEQRLDAAWGKMSVEGKTRLMRLHRALSEMPPDERKFIHDRVERFLNMSPAEREKLKQNRQQWEQMSPEQRQNAREEFRKRRQEFEERWHREHPGEDTPTNPPTDPKSLPSPPPTPPPTP